MKLLRIDNEEVVYSYIENVAKTYKQIYFNANQYNMYHRSFIRVNEPLPDFVGMCLDDLRHDLRQTFFEFRLIRLKFAKKLFVNSSVKNIKFIDDIISLTEAIFSLQSESNKLANKRNKVVEDFFKG